MNVLEELFHSFAPSDSVGSSASLWFYDTLGPWGTLPSSPPSGDCAVPYVLCLYYYDNMYDGGIAEMG